MRGRWVAIAVFVVGALAGGVSWVMKERKETAPPVPEAYVASSWDVVRNTPGHRVHVGQLHKPCTGCHDAVDGGLDRPGPEKCATCHEQRAHIRHGHMVDVPSARVPLAAQSDAPGSADASSAPEKAHAAGDATVPLSRCTDCHGFGIKAAESPTDCIRCHSSSQGDLHPVVTHASAPCTECHQVHENTIAPKECTSCHQISVKHGHPSLTRGGTARVDAGADIATQCRVCHDVHAEAHFAVDRCLSCHGPKGERPIPESATFEGGHTCKSCHRPHEFDKSKVAACVDCHKSVHPLAGHERQGCTGCHAPHAVRAQIEGGAVCTTCHKDVTLEHAGKQARDLGACTGCHVPHPPKPSAGPQPCTSCHQDIGGPTHTAHANTLACTSCHAPHAFHRELNIGVCRDCHAAQVTSLEKRREHNECSTCHQGLPHALGSPVQACGACHRDVQKAVHQGHAECLSCHQPHQASVQLASCEHCHAQQAKQHPRGHDQCTQCHDQHAAALKPGVADCTGCHQPAKLSGLHREPKHTENGCQQCHAPHGATPPGDRALCLSCHKDRVDHQPEATRCDGCHTFIGAQPRSKP